MSTLTMRPVKRGSLKLFSFIGLGVLAIIFLLPYAWMLGSAFKTRTELFTYVIPMSWKTFIPLAPTMENFTRLIIDLKFYRNIFNSLLLAAATVSTTMIFCSMTAFVLSMLDFPGRKVIFTLIMFTMLVPFEARMIPTFLVVQGLGMSDTFIALFLPWVADAFLIFLFSNHFAEIPYDLYHAAIIDGCSHKRVFWSVMFPNILPALISGGLIKFFLAWDAYVWPLIIIRNEKKQVISVAIANLFTDQSVEWELIFSSAVLSTIPVVILFLFLQRYYIAGMTSSGIKG